MTDKDTFLSPSVKGILIFTVILLTGILLVFIGNPFKKNAVQAPSPAPQINKIEISADAKSILDSDTQEIIFTIADAQKYLKDSGYKYDPNTFQDTNAKYAGDCFLSAALSNKKNRIINNNSVKGSIVFSTGCLPGDLPQPWVGVYEFGIKELSLDCSIAGKSCIDDSQNQAIAPIFKFLTAGSGRNFVWSADDKNISYEAVLGLSGKIEARMISSETGEVVKNTNDKNEPSGWKIYNDKVNGYEFQYPENLDIVNGDIRISITAEDTTYKILPEECPTRSFAGFSDEFDGLKTTINGIEYCEYTTGEGAAGTIIGYSLYTAVNNKKLYVISTSEALRNCENFCASSDENKCKKELEFINCTKDNNSKLDLVDKILSTFKFVK